MLSWRTAHLLLGWTFFAVFLASGFYLSAHMIDLIIDDPDARFAIRANHIYVLMASLLNLALAAVGSPASRGWRAIIRRVGRVLVLIAPEVLFAALVVEGPHPSPYLLERPLTLAGTFALTIGVLCAVAFVRPGAAATGVTPSRS